MPAIAIIFAIVGAVWRLEDRFVNRRDFIQLRREVSAIRVHLGVEDPNGDGPR
jgi:hypothetical protein